MTRLSGLLRRSMVRSLMIVVLMSMCGSAAFGQQIGHAQCCGKSDVILIRGGAGYWPGVNQLADHLGTLGFAPTILYPWENGWAEAAVVDAVQKGRLTGPLTIVGYSSGADSACWLCRRLQAHGLTVGTLVLVEPTIGVQVPSNVSYCLNLYKSQPSTDWIPAFRGVAVQAESPNTQLFNVDVKQHPQYGHLSGVNHFRMASTPEMRSYVGQVLVQRNQPLSQPTMQASQPAKPSAADAVKK